ncbi:NUDIX domain-containing protein [Paenibacillus sp. KACC 21273]|uniref:NUDIX domain-containing protein n=1 Tax=Paenibacillus sp. KACC 21273 TaxID=3025665 RepID=UPI00236588AE|nr:NUDIX domain-containing protein [Paenibacillus sp. KACC 21273]WDF49103.1 NUDIX domain-containing protein [Paenibacillus sp. KACC 21273]
MAIRTVCLCLLQQDQRFLFQRIENMHESKTMYRPIGGTMEYGESSLVTVKREVKEEIHVDIIHPVLQYVIENHFEYTEQDQSTGVSVQGLGHEITFIYSAHVDDPLFYKQDIVYGIESNEVSYEAEWKTLHELKEDPDALVVPEGLLELLLQTKIKEGSSSLYHQIASTT